MRNLLALTQKRRHASYQSRKSYTLCKDPEEQQRDSRRTYVIGDKDIAKCQSPGQRDGVKTRSRHDLSCCALVRFADSIHLVEKTTGEHVDLSHVHTTEQAVAMLDDLESNVR